MARDKSAVKRSELSRKIIQKENQMAGASRENQNFRRRIEAYSHQMDRLFQKEEEIYQEQAYKGQELCQNARILFDIRQDVQRVCARQINRMEQDYRKAFQNSRNEVEQLQKERNRLPWD